MKVVVTRLLELASTVVLVVANAVLIEMVLDMYGLELHRLLTGLVGTFLVIVSFGYSLRKRKIFITKGAMKGWLLSHEWLAIAGCFIIFIHTGTHIKAIVPVLTLVFLFVTFISGLIGRYVYNTTKGELKARRKEFKKEGYSDQEIEQKIWALTVTSSALSKWRTVHMPIVSILAILVLYHTVSALYFRGF